MPDHEIRRDSTLITKDSQQETDDKEETETSIPPLLERTKRRASLPSGRVPKGFSKTLLSKVRVLPGRKLHGDAVWPLSKGTADQRDRALAVFYCENRQKSTCAFHFLRLSSFQDNQQFQQDPVDHAMFPVLCHPIYEYLSQHPGLNP